MLTHPDEAAVTGAFGYTSRYVAGRLLDDGVGVRTLTGNPGREDHLAGMVKAHPLDFSDPEGLRRSDTMYPLPPLYSAGSTPKATSRSG